MSELPVTKKINVVIDDAWLKKGHATDWRRPHLGGSMIGEECERKLWYSFRWYAAPRFSGRMFRLFETGNLEERRIADDLRAIGCKLLNADPDPQHRVNCLGGHVGGSLDGGIVSGVPGAENTFHILEMKTHSHDSFLKLCGFKLTKNGNGEYRAYRDSGHMLSASTMYEKPLHYAQMMFYMGLTGKTRALYVAKNKNDDALAFERVEFVKAKFDGLMMKAERVVFSPKQLYKIGDKDYWECKFCQFKEVCHEGKPPVVSCRSCSFSKPTENGKWVCKKHHKELSLDEQKKACNDWDMINEFRS